MKSLIPLALLLAILPTLATCDMTTVDRNGRIVSLNVGGDEFAIATNFRMPLRGWGRQPSLSDARDVKLTTAGRRRTWSGRIELQPGKFYGFVQTLEEDGSAVNLEMKITAEAEVDLEGIYFWLDLPQSAFAGGKASLDAAGAPVASAVLPVEQPPTRYIVRGKADAMEFVAPPAAGSLLVGLDRAIPVMVQDNREWRGETYTAFCQLAPSLKSGESTSLKISLQTSMKPDTTPAKLSVDPARVRYHLDGFGGDYCFGVDSPVTQYTLKNLHLAWARTEMKAADWEPENDDGDPAHTNWPAFEARDRPGSRLRHDFEVARQIQGMGIPFVISVWDLPGWLYEDGGKAPRDSRHRVAPDKWPELLELLGSYLQYAKRQYGVEPDLFCFNEANIGVRVLFTPEEHREAIKRIGAYFKSLGLKTRMLLADATGPRGTYTYALPAAADPEAMQYVGAVAFHSWGGGSAADYSAWGDLAERLKLPLLVTELGVDAGAWQTRAYESFAYGLREVRMYQELLLYARPQGTMQWEFTGDYSTVRLEKDAQGNTVVVPTARFWFVKQFCNLTPYHSQALATASDNPKVLVTAFSSPPGADSAFTVHVANLGAARQASLAGLPRSIARLSAVRTSPDDNYRVLDPVQVKGGSVKLDLVAQSLLTLTTMQTP